MKFSGTILKQKKGLHQKNLSEPIILPDMFKQHKSFLNLHSLKNKSTMPINLSRRSLKRRRPLKKRMNSVNTRGSDYWKNGSVSGNLSEVNRGSTLRQRSQLSMTLRQDLSKLRKIQTKASIDEDSKAKVQNLDFWKSMITNSKFFYLKKKVDKKGKKKYVFDYHQKKNLFRRDQQNNNHKNNAFKLPYLNTMIVDSILRNEDDEGKIIFYKRFKKFWGRG